MGTSLSGSLSCCHFLCEFSRGPSTLHFTHFLIFRSCPGVPCSGGTPERVFLHFFWKRFRTRACTDIQHTCAQKWLFLQRQKNVFKSSYRVRGMGPPPGIHFCMCCYHNQQNKKTETKKIGAKLFHCGNSIFFAFSQRAPNCSIVVTVLNKTCDFFGFCFFVLLIVEAAHAKTDP